MLELNGEQRRAVEHGEGPLLVIAGPGSGKTRVITERIVHLLANVQGLAPENVLALTYTEKAAAEMLARVEKALPDLDKPPRIFTFHAFCFHVLSRRHFEKTLLDQVDVWIFLRRRMAQLGLDRYQKLAEPGAFLHDLNDFFSRCQDELVEPDDFEAYVREQEKRFEEHAAEFDEAERAAAQLEVEKKKELARVFRNSRQLIEQAGGSSFGSLISETLRLWEREPELLDQCRAQYRYVLVDEFQDTNFAQVELLRRLVASPHNITAVGDDDQAIYRFRGASHGQFRMFDDAFPGHQTVYLDRNYRSVKRILRVADVVIDKNERYQNKKPLRTENPEGEKVCVLDSPDYESEAAWIAREVERLVKRGRAYGEMAVLYRAHGHRDPLVAEFRQRHIPFSIKGLSILSTGIVRDLVAYLSVIHSPHDNVNLTRVLLGPGWRFPEELALPIRRQAVKSRCSIYSAIEAVERTLFRDDLERTGWAELKSLLKELKKVSEYVPVSSLFDRLADRLRLSFPLGDPDAAYAEAFRRFLQGWEEKSETRKLAEFMEYFGYFVEAGGTVDAPEPENAASAVQMMTVHAAKGLEFPVVFLISVAPRRFPHYEQKPVIEFPDDLRKGPAPPPDIHLEEERRLFYVALTRARERLYVSSVAAGGNKRTSLFIEDLLSDLVVTARDIERIQVPQSEARHDTAFRTASPAVVAQPSVPPSPSEAVDPSGQYSLFGNGLEPQPAPTYARPNLEAWASLTPADELIAPDGRLRLSATAIEAYRDCPLRFKFTHCFRIPTGPQATLTFGTLMHQCVRYYFDLRKKGLPSFEEVEEYYLRSWKGVGFEDSYQEETYRKAGLEQLREFVEVYNAMEIDAEHVASEQRFSLDLGDIALDGRIDQINSLNGHADAPPVLALQGVAVGAESEGAKRASSRSGSLYARGGNGGAEGRGARGAGEALPEVELVDYKTGRPQSQKDADKSLQLSVYALAARRQLQVDPVRLTFYNLSNNQAVSTVRLAKGLDNAVETIRGVADRIRNQGFDPKPGFACKRCEFVPICPAHEEG